MALCQGIFVTTAVPDAIAATTDVGPRLGQIFVELWDQYKINTLKKQMFRLYSLRDSSFGEEFVSRPPDRVKHRTVEIAHASRHRLG